MNNRILTDLIERLRVMESGNVNTLENFDIESGICDNLNIDSWIVSDEIKELMKQMFSTWGEYSGDSNFPIGENSDDAYNQFYNNYAWNKWLDDPYCNSRRRLAGHLANEFDKMLNDCVDMSEDAVLNRGYF